MEEVRSEEVYAEHERQKTKRPQRFEDVEKSILSVEMNLRYHLNLMSTANQPQHSDSVQEVN